MLEEKLTTLMYNNEASDKKYTYEETKQEEEQLYVDDESSIKCSGIGSKVPKLNLNDLDLIL